MAIDLVVMLLENAPTLTKVHFNHLKTILVASSEIQGKNVVFAIAAENISKIVGISMRKLQSCFAQGRPLICP